MDGSIPRDLAAVRVSYIYHALVSFQPRVQIEPSSSIDALAPKRVHFSPAQFIRSAEDF